MSAALAWVQCGVGCASRARQLRGAQKEHGIPAPLGSVALLGSFPLSCSFPSLNGDNNFNLPHFAKKCNEQNM